MKYNCQICIFISKNGKIFQELHKVLELFINLIGLLGVFVHLLLADPSAVYQVLDHLLWVSGKGPTELLQPLDHRVVLALVPELLI